MKWNAIITKSQYERARLRIAELGQEPEQEGKQDEIALLSILIQDYEQRNQEKINAFWREPASVGYRGMNLS